ncbi:MAG: hypothetical protein MJZ08_03505, partial [Bacteroidaceae bacterium]|nr:hypothetical protein [Bacteroidaceae bacterium]
GKIYDDCHTFTPPTEGEGETLIATVTFDGDAVKMKVKNGEETAYSLNETKPLETFFAHTFKLTANQDPKNPTDYYSTFFTSEGAYKLPEDVNAKAYIGSVEKKDERTKVLKLDAVSLIHKSEAVVLKANKSSITLMPSSNRQKASADNQLLGVDRSTILGEDDYALSYGQNGVGFYLWDGKTIGDNKAYLHLDEMEAKGVTFEFNDTPSGIENISSGLLQGDGVNLQGIHVGKNYKGIVIVRGKKYLKK